MKKILSLILIFAFVFSYFTPLSTVIAETPSYEVVSIKNDGSVNNIKTFSDYSSAKKEANNYKSTVNDVAVIKKNGKIIYAKYGIFRVNSNTTIITMSTEYGDRYFSPDYNTDLLFLDYDVNSNKVKVMLSGVVGWLSLDVGNIYPISYITSGNLLDTTKKYVKMVQGSVRLREGPGTNYKQIGCNGSLTCGSGIFASAGSIYEWLNSGSVTNDGTYDWYQVIINGNTGYIANDPKDIYLSEYDASIEQKQDFLTYYYLNSDSELCHSYYVGKLTSTWTTRLGLAPLYLEKNKRYYSFDGNYFYNDFTKLVNDMRNGNHNNAVNKLPYYNYYQYLPTRTETHYNADNLNSYIGYNSKINRSDYYQLVYDEQSKKYKWKFYGNWDSFPSGQSMLYNEGATFISSQEKYGVNAATTLALAIVESGWGRSYMSVREYNIFGHGAFDTAPDEYAASYESIAAGIYAHAYKYIALDYSNPIDGYNYNGSHYGNKLSGNNVRYASDAYWGEKMAGNYYSIDKTYGFQDYNQRLTFGIKQSASSAPIYSEPKTNSKKYYDLKAIPNIPVTILEEVKGESIDGNDIWYKIQSDVSIDANRNVISSNSTDYSYNFETSYAYIHSSYIYKESKEPTITASDITISSGSKLEPLKGVTAYDAFDGDVTSKIKIKSNNVDTNKVGTYSVIYSVTDSENNTAEKEIKVTVLSSAPTIVASNKETILGEEIDLFSGVTAKDYEDGDLTSKITIKENNLDINKLGTYKVTYYVKDSSNKETTKTIKVTVKEPNYKEKDALFYLDYIKNVNGKLEIKGYNTINGINNDLSVDIKYDVEFINIDTGKTYIQRATRITDKSEMTRPVYGLDDMDYTYSWFKLDIDLSKLPDGNYKMNIISKTKEFISSSVISNKLYKTQDTSFSGDKYVITRNNFDDKKGSIELNIRTNKLASKTASAEYNQYDTYRIFEFTKKGLLHLKGVSYSYGMNLASDQKISRKIIFENIDDYTKKYEFDLGSTTDGLYKAVLPVDDNFGKERAWYDAEIDISNLPIGKYVIYITTSSNITDIAEFTEKLNRELTNVKLTQNKKEYSFAINQDRGNRIELIVNSVE